MSVTNAGPLFSRLPSLSAMGDMYRAHPVVGKVGCVVSVLVLLNRLGGKVVLRNGKLISTFPYFLAPILQRAGFLPLLSIELFCSFQERFFPTPPLKGEPMDLETMKNQILEEKDVAFHESDFERLFESLPPVKSERLVGRCFDGTFQRTNRSLLDWAEWTMIRPARLLGFRWGKRFMGLFRGDPFLVNWFKRVYIPLPIAGNVCLRDLAYRNDTSATMSYDNHPFNDHFRLLQDDTESAMDQDKRPKTMVLLGAFIVRGKPGGYFTLKHDPSTPVI